MKLPSYPAIGRPPHEFGAACTSPAAWVGMMTQHLRAFARQYPLKPHGTPHTETLTGSPLVRHGVWKIACSCGEHPVYSPEWGLACCFHCGAVYDGIPLPPMLAEIERLLLLRPVMVHRNWCPPETVDDLRAENLAHGDPS